jgi:uncharacterized membrane protein
MQTNRLEAFSDGVIAIIITIMVLELRPPHGADLAALRPLLPVLVCYLLSFVYLGIYWSNHHHLMHAVQRVNGASLWANLHLLFWLSLIPFATAWMGENHFSAWPVALYGVLLSLCGVAYSILTRVLIAADVEGSTLAAAVGSDLKGILSVVIYLVAIAASLVIPSVSLALYVLVALIWLVPDRRIERVLSRHPTAGREASHSGTR